MKNTAILLVLAFAVSACNRQPGSATSDAVQQVKGPAPEFELANVAGGKLSSADIKGKVAVIDFWATWCVPCIQEIPNFNKLHAKHDGKGVQMLAVTLESGSMDSIKPKVKELKMEYPVVVGNDDVVEGFGGLIGFPTTFVVTKDWKIYKKYFGMTPNKIEKIEKDVETLLAEQAE
jgi:thiol-disulfide isomerase/thioredoxin